MNDYCTIVAEAGLAHGGSLMRAMDLADAAKTAGADAVKFQVFRADRLYPKHAGMSDYLNVGRSIYDIIAELEMPYAWLPALAAAMRAANSPASVLRNLCRSASSSASTGSAIAAKVSRRSRSARTAKVMIMADSADSGPGATSAAWPRRSRGSSSCWPTGAS